MDRIDSLRLFTAVAELGSFTKAADRMGMTPGAASKQISALEEHLQARLLERTTRSVRLTDAGEALLDRVRPWLGEYEEIENGLAHEQAAAAGLLRVSTAVDFGSAKLIEPIAAFMRQWPSVEVRLDFTDRMIDIVDEGFDVAIRIGQLPDSSLIAKRLAHAPMAVVASDDYLQAAGTPSHPSELSGHACIIDRNKPTPNQWRFMRGQDDIEVKVSGRLTLNGARAAVASAAEGAGIACTPAWAAEPCIQAGRVQRLLSDWDPDHRDLWAVFPSNRYMAHRVRLFVDFLADWFKAGI